MADYTDDVTRLAEMLRPHFVSYTSPESLAFHLLEQGVTLPPPPPDPAMTAEDVVRQIVAWDNHTCGGLGEGDPERLVCPTCYARAWLPTVPPAPDPAVVVARVLAGAATPGLGWGPVDLYPVHADLLVAVRDLFSPEALAAAAAKVQEAET